MAKRKLDLSGMYANTTQIQDTHKIDTIQIHDSNENQHEKYAAYRRAEAVIEKNSAVPETLKKINMAFTDTVYTTIKCEAEKSGVTAAYYINSMIRNADPEHVRAWYDQLPMKPSKDFVPRRKGQASKRIYVKFDADVYDKIVEGSVLYNQTITQYVNMILESNTR